MSMEKGPDQAPVPEAATASGATVSTRSSDVHEGGRGTALDTIEKDQARDLTDRIKAALTAAWDLIVEAHETRSWVVLGYPSWDDYCAQEFDAVHRLRLPRDERTETVLLMRDAGMSTRAIASATGLSKSTVAREAAGVPDGTRAPVAGSDGKRYAGKVRDADDGIPPVTLGTIRTAAKQLVGALSVLGTFQCLIEEDAFGRLEVSEQIDAAYVLAQVTLTATDALKQLPLPCEYDRRKIAGWLRRTAEVLGRPSVSVTDEPAGGS